jgi:sulfur carrier protein
MFVIVNGERHEVPAEATVTDIVRILSGSDGRSYAANGRGVAVAVEGEVVPRDDWSSTRLGDGARVEVLAAIQGGSA